MHLVTPSRLSMRRLRWPRWLGLGLLVFLVAGCDQVIVVNVATKTPTLPPATATETVAPPSPAPPTATLAPPTPSTPTVNAPTPAPAPTRIEFAPGAISATVGGHVEAHGDRVYVLRALAGQTMTVELVSPAADVVLEIWGEDGQPLLRHVTGQTFWTEHLHATQDYFIKVVSFGSAVDYTLTVTIPPPEEGPTPEPTPTRIEFAPGAISATVGGHVEAHGDRVYVLRALADQTMTVELVSPAADVVLEIWGEDGQPLLRHVTGQTFWTGHLHATQDYFIKVVSFGSAVDYTLTVTIPPPEEGPTPEPEPTRIEFAPGAISATVGGHVEAHGDRVYVLRALAGQTMTVELVSPAADVVLEIWGEDGQPLLRHVTGQTFWTGDLHATQDYFIKVVSFGSAVDYTLTVTIPPP